MPKTIEIDGTIGWDVWPSMVSEQLKQANGEDVEIMFSSPGGYIDDGLAIFNLIHDYKGKTTAIIIGMAASMASYIPLAADKVIAKSNAVYMIHDALAGLYGNEAEHKKIAKILGGFSNLISDIYEKKTGKTKKEIRALMQEESYFFGSEMLDAGFVDEIDEVEVKKTDKDEKILDVMAKVEMTASRVKERPENYNKIAAFLPRSKDQATVFSPPERPALSNIQQGENSMDMKKLKAEFSDVYQAVFDEGKTKGIEASKETHHAEGKAAGILAERARISAIEALSMPAEFTAKAKTEDWSPEMSAMKYLEADALKKKEIAANIEGDTSRPLASNAPIEPTAPEGDDAKDPVAEYQAAVGKLVAEGKTEGEAMKAVKTSNPEMHQKYLDAYNKGEK